MKMNGGNFFCKKNFHPQERGTIFSLSNNIPGFTQIYYETNWISRGWGWGSCKSTQMNTTMLTDFLPLVWEGNDGQTFNHMKLQQ